MPIDAAFLAASCTGILGALAVTGVGACFTRKLRALGWGAVLSGTALGALEYVLWGWFTHGFDWFQVCVPPLAALILLLVMAAQNWFVFYEDRQDVLQCSRPALVALAAGFASLLAWKVAGRRSIFVLLPLIWAGAGSLAILWCIDSIQRSIERTRGAVLGTLVGICKVLLPLTGIVVFVDRMKARPPAAEDAGSSPDRFAANSFVVNFLGLFWDVGRLALAILINGARVPPHETPLDPLECLWQQKGGQSITGEMPRLKRDSVVLIFVLAIHVLCGVLIVRA
jgi:hypothetical protein